MFLCGRNRRRACLFVNLFNLVGYIIKKESSVYLSLNIKLNKGLKNNIKKESK